VKTRKLAVIGGGPGGTEVVRTIAASWLARGQGGGIEITIFEPQRALGMGAAWRGDSPLLACNMPAATINLGAGAANQVEPTVDVETEDFSEVSYLSRASIGGFIEKRWQATTKLATTAGIQTRHIVDAVSEIHKTDGGFEIVHSDGASTFVDYVIIALGGVPQIPYPALLGHPNYFSNGWDIAHLIRSVDAGARVAILGTGPTAVDVAVTLSAKQRAEPISLFSQNGKLPWVRPRYDHKSAPVFASIELIDAFERRGGALSLNEAWLMYCVECYERGATLDDVRRVRRLAGSPPPMCLEAGLAEADSPQAYFTALKSIDSLVPYMWRALSQQGRLDYWRDFRAEFARISYAIPPINAERILRGMEEGSVRTYAGVRNVTVDELSRRFMVTRDHETFEFDVIVNATGFGGDLSRLQSPLVAQMAADGLLLPHAFGGARVAFTSGAVLRADGRPLKGMYCIAGSLTVGTHLFVNALSEAAQSARRTGHAVVDEILASVQTERFECTPAEVSADTRDQRT